MRTVHTEIGAEVMKQRHGKSKQPCKGLSSHAGLLAFAITTYCPSLLKTQTQTCGRHVALKMKSGTSSAVGRFLGIVLLDSLYEDQYSQLLDRNLLFVRTVSVRTSSMYGQCNWEPSSVL